MGVRIAGTVHSMQGAEGTSERSTIMHQPEMQTSTVISTSTTISPALLQLGYGPRIRGLHSYEAEDPNGWSTTNWDFGGLGSDTKPIASLSTLIQTPDACPKRMDTEHVSTIIVI